MAIKMVSAEQMREIDRKAIHERNIPGLELMEHAGRAVADDLADAFSPKRVGIVTGKGNNAGDGLVVARLLKERGVDVILVMLADGQNLSESGRANFEKLPDGIDLHDRHALPDLEAVFKDCDVIVDAILGTGLSGPIRGTFGEAVARVNDLDIPVVSIDVPSGLNSDTGQAEGACIVAQRTVTMGLPKRGLVLGHGELFAGDILVAEIGFPDDLLHSPDIKEQVLELEDAVRALPVRPVDGHKGSFGGLLVLAGSKAYSGAAFLTVSAGLRSGCGMVYAALPENVMERMANRLIEAIKVSLPGGGGDEYLSHETWSDLEPWLEKADAIALGPGIGTEEETARLVDEIVCVDLPMVIDADALNCLEEKALYLTERKAPTVLTPHPGEMGRILGMSAQEVQADRIEAATRLAREGEVVVLLKGWRTIVASPEGQVYVNPTGNSGMAKGGTGDVLTGLIGGFLAQGCSALDAACAGAFLHGLSGDLAREELGERGMTARDVLRRMPEALKMCESS